MRDHFRALARIGHSLEDRMLDIFVDDLVLNLTVKNGPRSIRVTQFDAFVKGNLVARIAEPVQLFDLELIQGVVHGFSPAWHMLLYVIEDHFWRLTTLLNKRNLECSTTDPRVCLCFDPQKLISSQIVSAEAHVLKAQGHLLPLLLFDVHLFQSRWKFISGKVLHQIDWNSNFLAEAIKVKVLLL